ncbi:cellulose binding domain-containing protein [Cellulosilyticum ruminicola]|uniref:cellulose binding domain-containing protein n=1 Tax=Cellulosilyticum ruminicola TaxID=425254 RepID=UPI0006D2C1BB|nr:cellulose binding domain-containing protein [Cellulosilyticum ruminicola]
MNKKLTYLISATLIMSTLSTQAVESRDIAVKDYVTTSITTGNQLATNLYEGKGFEVDFQVNHQWLGGYNGELILKNTSDEPLEDWALAFDLPSELSDVWGAEIASYKEGHYILKNTGWNQSIAAGESIHIGFNGVGIDAPKAPQTYTFLTAKEKVTPVTCAASFKKTESWQEGFNGEIIIENTTDETIDEWVLAFDFEGEIESFWSAEIISHEDNHYVIKNKAYNGEIIPSQTLTLGFVGSSKNEQAVPTHYEMSQIGKVYEEPIDYEKDMDADNLPDYYENILGTNPNNADTDGDGLPDGYEVLILGTSPLLKDSVDDSIQDGDEDLDEDGLSNIKEYELGTNPKDKDTDGDGVLDGEEVDNYGTNPLLKDTDEDGLCDGDEIKLGFKPLVKDSDGNGIIDGEEKVEQVFSQEIINDEKQEVIGVEVGLKCAGSIDEVVSVRDTYGEDILSSKVSGLVGSPIQITSEQDFEEATITFKYDENLLGDTKEEDLALVWYDEANNHFKIFDKESIVDKENNTVSYKTTHFSTYLLVDQKKWEEPNSGRKIYAERDRVENKAARLSQMTLRAAASQTAIVNAVASTNSTSSVDSDYDGRIDSQDSNPNNNGFSGTLHTSFADSKVSYTMDYREFFKDNTSYSKKISTISSLYSTVIYSGANYEGQNIQQFMSANGLTGIERYNLADQYSDSDVSEAYIGHRKVTYNGQTREIVAVVVRGTNGTIQEWSSNFDIGTTTKKSSYTDWTTANNHKGFDIAATRILKCLTSYENSHQLDANAKKAYWVMGHSRGAAIANIIGAKLVDQSKCVYAYTFAAPNTTTAKNASSYAGIYNILNKDDFVPYLPMSAWGFTHYGKSVAVSIADNYETEWEKLTGCKNKFGIVDYDMDTIGMDDTIEALGELVSNRNECYKYTCKCHGDGSLDNISVKNYGMSKSSREGAIAKIPSVALPYCKITRYDGGLISGWDFKVCQQPEYFMQVLAAYMAGDISAVRFVIELDTADRYKKVKARIISSGLGGLEHPHYPESYYVLSTHITNSSF